MNWINLVQKRKINLGRFKFFSALAILMIISTGCVSVKNKEEKEVNTRGGFFISEDSGETWLNRVAVYSSSQDRKSFGSANVISMAFDPQDQAAIYVGTQNHGIFYTYNYGQGWVNTLANKGSVNDIIVHPEHKCTIYAAVHNTIWKTEDCSRTWKDIYFEDRAGQFINAMAINYDDANTIYAGTSGGSVLVSRDGGNFWDVIYRFDDAIRDIIIQNHNTSSEMYILTKSKGVFRSVDSGVVWNDLMQLDAYKAEVKSKNEGKNTTRIVELSDEPIVFSKISGVKNGIAIEADVSQPDSLIYINSVGMFRLTDSHWEQIQLLTPTKKDTIYSVAVNPLNGNEIYYGTDSALYRSIDNGVNWSIKKLPAPRAAKVLEFSPNNKYLYLGTLLISK